MTALRLVVGAGLQAANDPFYEQLEYYHMCNGCQEDEDYCTCGRDEENRDE